MKELSPYKVFVQYRGIIRPYEPILSRKYTITHSDTTADLFVFVDKEYANDQITSMRDEVKIAWEQTKKGLALMGSVLVDEKGTNQNASIRYRIFYEEMPTALKAMRQADRFLFEKTPELDNAPVFIQFHSSNPEYNKTIYFGEIGLYQ